MDVRTRADHPRAPSTAVRRRDGIARGTGGTAAVAGLLLATTAAAGVLRMQSADAALRCREADRPQALAEIDAPFTLLAWVGLGPARDAPEALAVIGLGDAISVEIDPKRGRWRVHSEALARPDAIELPCALPDHPTGDPPPESPVIAWSLLAIAFDPGDARVEIAIRHAGMTAHASAALDGSRLRNGAWPVRLGADGGRAAFGGAIGLTLIERGARAAGTLAPLVEALWPTGEPSYGGLAPPAGSPAWSDVAWMIGHGVFTYPSAQANPAATGAEVGAPIAINSLPIYNPTAGADFFSVGVPASIAGTWTFETPFRTWDGNGWSFRRAPPDIGLGGPRWTPRPGALVREVAAGAPTAIRRVVITANSRAARTNAAYYGGLLESWAFGGLYPARRSAVSGVIIPAWPAMTPWPFFRSTARVEGDVRFAGWTSHPTATFGSFGSHGQDFPALPGYPLAGTAAIITPGAAYVPKARPEAGTRLDSVTQPVLVRACLLRAPGAGRARFRGEKATAQGSAGTADGEWQTIDLDTTTVIHPLVAGDGLDQPARTIRLAGHVPGIAAGDGCFIADGFSTGGISLVSAVDFEDGTDGPRTVVVLERWFSLTPVVGGSVLHFGPVEPHWVAHAWPGLPAGDASIYRGIRIEAENAPVVLLFTECLRPDQPGLVIGAVGRAGWGYGLQLQRSLTAAGGLMWARAIQPDVVLQFFAHQQAQVTDMAAYTAQIRRAAPGTDVWWCGDPDLDGTQADAEGTDAWHPWILDHADAFDVGAVSAHESPQAGRGLDRAANGEVANGSHPSARGCQRFMEATLTLLIEATAPRSTCPADLTGDGTVDFADLLALIATWGACPGLPDRCPADLSGDAEVGLADLLALLAAWGGC